MTAGKRPSGYAVLDGSGALLDLGPVRTDADILALSDEHRVAVAAIDSPLDLQLGVDCFDETHDCAPVLPGKGKESERQLARLGIPCYYTSKRSILRTVIQRAMGLRAALEARGVEVIEVYPYSVMVRLWCGCPPPRRRCPHLPKKTTPYGLAVLRERLAARFPNFPAILDGKGGRFTHDVADGLLAAWTAHLYLHGQTDALGHPEEGYIIIPARP